MASGRRFFTWFSLVGLMAVIALTACSFEPEDPAYQENDEEWEFNDGDGDDAGADENDEVGDAGTSGDTSGANDTAIPDDDAGGSEDTSGNGQTDVATDADDENGSDFDADPIETCDGDEVDTSTDSEHCGGCGNACDPDFGHCEGGQCVCPDGFEACGSDNRCEYVEQEPSHCGSCGNDCGPGMACQAGQCVCRTGFTMCGGECVDTSRDPLHCGDCNEDCGYGKCENGECGAGGCSLTHRTCEPDDADGLACFPRQGGSNSLYCIAEWDDTCGQVCQGNELCQALEGCIDYRAARGCDECPCDDCEEGENCIDDLASMEGVYCVEDAGWSW